ncbi:MAG: HEPN domain-containing protein [Candidatus Diapherotrites archaeon]|nr:HEPN domain-containing protein [Candidatus Diapherotrites archaeon]
MRTRIVEKFKYNNFLQKAREFYDEMNEAHAAKRWNAVGLNGIHCAISCCDAVTVYFLGKRSAGERHEEVVKLLQQIKDVDEKVIKQRIVQILDVLRSKTRVEYHAEVFSEKEAGMIVKQTKRVYEWTTGLLK